MLIVEGPEMGGQRTSNPWQPHLPLLRAYITQHYFLLQHLGLSQPHGSLILGPVPFSLAQRKAGRGLGHWGNLHSAWKWSRRGCKGRDEESLSSSQQARHTWSNWGHSKCGTYTGHHLFSVGAWIHTCDKQWPWNWGLHSNTRCASWELSVRLNFAPLCCLMKLKPTKRTSIEVLKTCTRPST